MQQGQKIVLAEVEFEPHRRRKAAQQRSNRRRRDVEEGDLARRPAEFENAAADFLRAGAVGFVRPACLQRDLAAAARDEAERDRNHQRLLARLPGGRRRALGEIEGQRACRCIVMRRDAEFRRARLIVPAHEFAEIAPGRFGETGDEILDGGRRSVIALKIQIHAAPEGLGADQNLQHADDLGALLVDGRRIEIVDFEIGLRPHVMGERSGVLGKLGGAQRPHVGDALDGARTLIGGEFLVAKDGQALLSDRAGTSRGR